ncbi:MAG: hypothetical protein KJ621_10445 [Proteobacteria bacterium]|nr:hypothetical protein [Pseudomonadota bacterium]
MRKILLRVGLPLLVLVLFGLGYLAHDLFWPRAFTPPARVMPPGAVFYLALENLRDAVERVEDSRWWASIADQLRADKQVKRHLERLRRELSRNLGFDLTRANVMSFLGRHASVSLYPAATGPGWPGLMGLDFLIAARIDYRFRLLKWFLDVGSWFSSGSDFSSFRYQGHQAGRWRTDVQPVYFLVRPNNTVFISNARGLIEAVIDRLQDAKLPRLAGDAEYRCLGLGRPEGTRLTGFVRLGHPKMARWRSFLAWSLARGLPRPALVGHLIALPPPLAVALYHGVTSIKTVRLVSDLRRTELTWVLGPGPGRLRRLYARVLQPEPRLDLADLLARPPLAFIGYAGLRLPAYFQAMGSPPQITGMLNGYAPLLGYKTPGELTARTGPQLGLAVVSLGSPGLLGLPTAVVVLQIRDEAAADRMVGRIVALVKANPNLGSSLNRRPGPRRPIHYVATLAAGVGLTRVRDYLVAANAPGVLAAAQVRRPNHSADPHWAAAIKDRRTHYLAYLSPYRILHEPKRLMTILFVLRLSARTLAWLEPLRAVDAFALRSSWNGRDQGRLVLRLSLTDRPLRQGLPLGLIRRWLTGLSLSPPVGSPPGRPTPLKRRP